MSVGALWLVALGAALLVYHRLPARAQPFFLLGTSYAAYACLAWRFLPVLVALTLAGYAIAARMGAVNRSPDEIGRRRRWLWAGVVINVLTLSAVRLSHPATPFVAPFAVLGISFYVLQILAYLFDTYSGALRTSHTLVDFMLYVAYFPKLAAGPIERPQAFFRQLAEPRRVDDTRLARATTLIAVGLTRKLAFADPLASLLPADIWTAPASFGALMLACSTVGYAFVLYNDFAGYTSIARGVSALFGIELSRNFAQPFLAHSFTDLWNRWHISFSHWLRDYVYLPVSRALLRRNLSRDNVTNLILPPLTTMLICGLWHGASAHMLLWGGLHGVYLILERVRTLRSPRVPGDVLPAWRQAAGIILVFSVSCWTLVALRLPVDRALQFWWHIMTGPVGGLPDARWLLYMLPSLWLDVMQARHGEDTVFAPWPRLARAAVLATAVLLWLVMSGRAAPTPFVYQGF